jgi:hypothetical protein
MLISVRGVSYQPLYLMFLHRDHVYICGRLDFASALETNDNRSAMNSDIFTVGVGALVTNLYAI